jgi:hypothetical protein
MNADTPRIPAEAPSPSPPQAGPDDPIVASLSQSDLALVRVLEDLIDTLIERGVMQFTDLPEAAQSKLLGRRESRAALRNALRLLPSDDSELALGPRRDA